jgi:acetyl esterase/lipase
VLGFSAGGHLAATCSTATDAELEQAGVDAIARPDLAVLCYPVIRLTGPFAHVGSRKNLLGDADDTTAATLDLDTRVTSRTPPTFLYSTAGDPGVPIENSLAYAAALRQHGVPFALHVTDHVTAQPTHGTGLAEPGSPRAHDQHRTWTHHAGLWLRARATTRSS